tara:strand:+ start:2605 stop:2808 length:204 start_codon:yes stop_codon:yes gene_type:complete
MQYVYCMISYLDQLMKAAKDRDISILAAFRKANVPTSTFYRTRAGKDLRLSTARKVMDAITSSENRK